MNDITKARAFLHALGSDLQYLQSFGLMLATAEETCRNFRLRQQGNKEVAGTLTDREVNAVLELAVLRYLKRNNRLPQNITDAFAPDLTVDRKRELALSWMNG